MNSIVKTDSLLQVVFAELYAPDIVDSQRDFMTRDEIRKSCWGFMKSGRNEIDVEHDGVVTTCAVVESFIARDDDPVFVPGSWVLGVHVPETELWGRIVKGELNGLSMDAVGLRTPTQIEMEIPSTVTGETVTSDGHGHAFAVQFGPDGTFLSGATEPAEDGHWHLIKRGTVTEKSRGHAHRFSFVELLR
jgi:hypothetical protein